MMAERGVVVDHSTLHRGVIRLVPPLPCVSSVRPFATMASPKW
ncbi:hypothetical protein SPM24T3_23217 [Serratia sp. M24T3]|nr:hypothetical protein SPM24T3_23217 [Serratia sp. M24T3]